MTRIYIYINIYIYTYIMSHKGGLVYQNIDLFASY